MAFFHDMATNPFLLTGLLAGLLASVACGIVGPYVITRRIVFLSGAIAHMSVGGLGAAIWLHTLFPDHLGWLRPMYGALVAALLGAMLIALVHERVAERMDTLIGAMWAIGMALGILLVKLTPGYQNDLMSYLFGNITFVPWSDVQLLLCLDLIIIVTVALFHKRLLTICLDQQQAELQGIHVLGTNMLLLCLVALTVMCLTQVVGLILVIALLCLPAATAAHHVGRFVSMMTVSTILCALVTTLPRIAVYDVTFNGTPLSAESTIVLAAGTVYIGSLLFRGALERYFRSRSATVAE